MATKGKYVYDWPRPMVSVDIVVFAKTDDHTKVLLIKRGKEPYKDKWAFPGGFLEMDEELKSAALRELKEETGLGGVELKQMHTFGKIGRDPRGRQVTVAFIGVIDEDTEVKGGDDASEAKWFDIDDLGDMAFDHNQMAKMAISKLKEL